MPENCPIEITPYAQAELPPSQKVFNLNYTNQDFWSLKSRLVDFTKERFGPNGTVIPNTFNDFVESSIAVMLIENWAFLADTLSFKMDQIVNELFIDTVTEVENAFRLSKLVGFTPQPPISARSLWTATIINPQNTDLVIETPVVIDMVSEQIATAIELFPADSENQPKFGEDIILPAGASVNQSIIGLEGRTFNDTFTGTGAVSQTIQLSKMPVIADSIRVQVDGILWDRIEYFTDSQPRREFRIEFDSEWRGFVIFGNNRAGLIPGPGSRISIQYRVGGGTLGNIVTGFIETQRQVEVPGKKFSIPVTYRNYTKGEFGYDGDTIEEIRRKLPLWLRTQNRAVSGSDYKTLVDQFATPYSGQIGKSTAVLRNHGCAGNIIDIYMLARDGNDNLTRASNELKVLLNEELNKKKMLTDFICIRDGVIVEVDVMIDLTLDKFYRKFELEYRENVLRRINRFFSLNNWEYNQDLKNTNLIKEISDIKEIKSIESTFVTSDPDNSGELVTTRFYEIIRPSDISISFLYV